MRERAVRLVPKIERAHESQWVRVQVKHRRSRSGGLDVRNFLATLRGDDRGLFVSTGGLTKDGSFEASRTSHRIHCTLLDRDDFVELLTEQHGFLDAEARRLLPLKKVCMPIAWRRAEPGVPRRALSPRVSE